MWHIDPEQFNAATAPLREMSERLILGVNEACTAIVANFIEGIDWAKFQQAIADLQVAIDSARDNSAFARSIKRKRVRRAQWRKRK